MQQNEQRRGRIQPRDNGCGPYYVILAGNGQVLLTSEIYSSDAARDEGIEAARRALRQELGLDEQE